MKQCLFLHAEKVVFFPTLFCVPSIYFLFLTWQNPLTGDLSFCLEEISNETLNIQSLYQRDQLCEDQSQTPKALSSLLTQRKFVYIELDLWCSSLLFTRIPINTEYALTWALTEMIHTSKIQVLTWQFLKEAKASVKTPGSDLITLSDVGKSLQTLEKKKKKEDLVDLRELQADWPSTPLRIFRFSVTKNNFCCWNTVFILDLSPIWQ